MQCSVLGPIAFIIYFSDVDVRLNNLISKFADDTKIGNSVFTDWQAKPLKRLALIVSLIWEVEDAVQFRKVSGTSTYYYRHYYEVCGVKLKSVQCAKDLGVKIASNLKFSQQGNGAGNKANSVVGCIDRKNSDKDKDVMLPLFNTLVTPHLEYAVLFWSSHFVKDIDC